MYQQTCAKLRKLNASTEGLASGHSNMSVITQDQYLEISRLMINLEKIGEV